MRLYQRFKSSRCLCLASNLLSLTASIFLLVGCTSETSDRMLRFFFDGVPVRENPQVAPYSAAADGEEAVDENEVSSKKPAPILRLHDPFDERDCEACHETKFSRKLTGSQLDVCFGCHDDFHNS